MSSARTTRPPARSVSNPGPETPLEADVGDPDSLVDAREAVRLEQPFELDGSIEPTIEVVVEQRRFAGMGDEEAAVGDRDTGVHPPERLLRQVHPSVDPCRAHETAPSSFSDDIQVTQ